MQVKRNILYLTAATIWGIPGVIIAIKGVMAYSVIPHIELCWLLPITIVTLIAFRFIFRRIVSKYSARITQLPPQTSILKTFPLKGWILILFMMCLGITLRNIPSIPLQFTASFYSGLGPMLIWSAANFLHNYRHSR